MKTTTLSMISLVAMMNHDDEVLLLKRASAVHCPNLWSFPGGKMQAGELALQTAMRELKEETDVTAELWQQMGEYQYQYDDRRLSFSFFFCYYDGLSPIQAESEYQWFKLENLRAVNMPEANQALISMLLKHKHKDM